VTEEFRVQFPISVGDKFVTIARKGKGDTIIGKFTDGRVILFTRWKDEIRPGAIVKGTIVHAKENFLLMEPEELYNEDDDYTIGVLLDQVSNSGHFQHAILARALRYILNQLKEMRGSV